MLTLLSHDLKINSKHYLNLKSILCSTLNPVLNNKSIEQNNLIAYLTFISQSYEVFFFH